MWNKKNIQGKWSNGQMGQMGQMGGKYAKTIVILNCRSWDFKTLLVKTNPTLIDIFLDNPKSSQKKC